MYCHQVLDCWMTYYRNFAVFASYSEKLWWHMGLALRLVYVWLKIASWTMVQRHSCKEYNQCRAVNCSEIREKYIIIYYYN
jgi:hypothetical protein